MAARFQELIKSFQELGIDVDNSIKLAREQLAIEREDRLKERELAAKEAAQQAEEKAREVEQQLLREKQQAEEKERAAELARKEAKFADELKQREHERNMDLNRLKQQRELAELESQLRRDEFASRVSSRTDLTTGSDSGKTDKKFNLNLGMFSNRVEDLEPFITRFENVAKAYQLPDRLYAVEFSKTLSAESLQVYETLSSESRLDYNKVIEAMKRRFGITLSSYRKRFLNAKVLPNELQSDFVARIQKLFVNWLKAAGYEQTFEDVFEHVVLDRYLASQEKDLKIYLKEKGKLKLPELAQLAQCYLDARESEYRPNDRGQGNSEVSKHKKFESKHKPEFKSPKFDSNKSTPNDVDETKGGTYSKSKSPVTCFTCGKVGHKSFDCDKRKSQPLGDRTAKKTAACQLMISDETLNQVKPDVEAKGPNNSSWPTVAVASQKNDLVYLADLRYPLRGKCKIEGKTVKFLRDTGSSVSILKSCYLTPENYTGSTTTVLLADRCVRHLPNAVIQAKLPGFEGPLKVCVMDDPVSDLIIGNDLYSNDCQSDNEKEDDFDGDDESGVASQTLIFENSKHQSPQITTGVNRNVDMESKTVRDRSPSHVRLVSRVSTDDLEMGETDADPIVKSVSANDETDKLHKSGSEELSTPTIVVARDSETVSQVSDFATSAVQTRQQVRQETKSKRPLKVTVVDELNISSDEFRTLQETDDKLQRYWELAKSPPSDRDNRPNQFVIKHGLLYRIYKPNPHVDAMNQLVVPNCLEQKVISYAHDTALSGHGSQASTYRKLTAVFYIPGASGKCRDYVKSCLLCQKGGNRNVHGKAPLMSMPQISEPFHTVYVDLVGEIHPASADGHRYILCATDACTHFPFAIPLKKTDSVTIAEAMLSQFNIFGHPRHIICDNAANLTSDIIKEIYHVYGMNIKQIPVYRPQANSVQERSHSEIKRILRKLCVEQPRQWHRYIDPLMFAIRTTENSNGFTPFELLFGRKPYTHLNVLRDLWTGHDSDPEVKTTYQYVLDLRNRIEETCEMAHKEIAKTHLKNKRYFDKYAKLRELKAGDQVLVLSPKPKNKLEFIWKGPAEVIERRGVVNYRIKFKSGTERTYHINMLKPFVSREPPDNLTSPLVNEISDNGDHVSESSDDDETEVDQDGISAAVMGLVECSEDEDDDDLQCKTETSQMELYNTDQTETWEDVQINPDLSENEKQQLIELIKEFQDIFSDVPTQTHLVTHKIRLKSDEPVYSRPYKIPVHMMERVDKEIDLMLKQKIIERCVSNYASPMVIVKKRNSDQLRLCIDYSKLNALCIPDPMPQPEPEDILAKLGNAQVFSTFDASKGFYAIPMDPDSMDYTSFVTPRDTYRFRVMPFGCSTSPATYNRMVRTMLQNAKNLDSFVDDIIAYTANDFDLHIQSLRDLFTRVRNANIKLKPSKARVGYREIQFLGFVVSQGKIRPTQESIDKILNAPVPRTKKGVRSLCGCINWLRRYIPRAAKLLKPLSDLTVKNASEIVKWGAEHDAALQQVKEILTTKPVLSLYDVSKPHVLQTDASSEFIGGVLLQLEDDCQLHPIMYASRKCLDRESRYDIQNKEMLAIVWCCRRFYKYLYGSHFTIQTDCQALTMLNGRLSNNARVVRWQLEMQAYDYRVEIIKGRDNQCADFLSRMGT